MKYNELTVGMKAEIEKVFDLKTVQNFADLVNDHNPIHLDEEYASKSIFKKRIVHGLLVSGLISAVIGTKLPGEGSIYLGQTLNFIKPVYLQDKIKAKVEVLKLRDDKKLVTLKTTCVNQNNEEVITGEAVVKLFQ